MFTIILNSLGECSSSSSIFEISVKFQSLYLFLVVSLLWLQILNLAALLQNKNTRLGPFPWKRSVLQNPDRVRTNQSARICLRLALPYNNYFYCLKLWRKKYFHSKMAWPPLLITSYLVTTQNWPSLNVTQIARKGWTNSYWKHQVLMLYPLGKNLEKPWVASTLPVRLRVNTINWRDKTHLDWNAF